MKKLIYLLLILNITGTVFGNSYQDSVGQRRNIDRRRNTYIDNIRKWHEKVYNDYETKQDKTIKPKPEVPIMPLYVEIIRKYKIKLYENSRLIIEGYNILNLFNNSHFEQGINFGLKF